MTLYKIYRHIDQALKYRPLPGSVAQLKMAPLTQGDLPVLKEAAYGDSSTIREAAVLMLISPPEESPRLPLILRGIDGGVHSGQIAIPGGCREPGEAFPVETALREAREEINLDTGDVNILGLLTPLYIPVSNIRVSPVLACAEHPVELRVDGIEATRIFWLDIETLLEEPLEGSFYSNSRGNVSALYYPAAEEEAEEEAGEERGDRVWGATAMMLGEFAALLKNL